MSANPSKPTQTTDVELIANTEASVVSLEALAKAENLISTFGANLYGLCKFQVSELKKKGVDLGGDAADEIFQRVYLRLVRAAQRGQTLTQPYASELAKYVALDLIEERSNVKAMLMGDSDAEVKQQERTSHPTEWTHTFWNIIEQELAKLNDHQRLILAVILEHAPQIPAHNGKYQALVRFVHDLQVAQGDETLLTAAEVKLGYKQVIDVLREALNDLARDL